MAPVPWVDASQANLLKKALNQDALQKDLTIMAEQTLQVQTEFNICLLFILESRGIETADLFCTTNHELLKVENRIEQCCAAHIV